MAKPSRRFWFRLAAIVFGFVAIYVVLEVGLLAYMLMSSDDKEGHVEEGQGEPFTLTTMQKFLADLPNEPDRKRLLFLGDSYTDASGVPRSEGFVHKVDVLLEQRKPGRYRTINLGVPGSEPIRQWALYNRARDAARPHVLIHMIAPNDLDADVCKDLFPVLEFVGQRTWPARYSFLWAMCEMKIREAVSKRRFVDYLRGGAEPEERERAWRIFKREILATKKLAEEGDAMYVMVRFPLVSRLENYPLRKVHERGAEFAKQIGVPYLDLMPFFEGRSSDNMALPGDPHPSAEAHSIAAEAITDWLLESILPKLPDDGQLKPLEPRTFEQINAAEIQHFKGLLEMDPTCRGAKYWMDRLLTETQLMKKAEEEKKAGKSAASQPKQAKQPVNSP